MATIKKAKSDGSYYTRSHYLMESKRLEFLGKAIKASYGLDFTIGELQKLDKTIMSGIDKLLK